MLFNVFERKTAGLKAKVKGDNVSSARKWLAAQREKEGYMSQFVADDKEGGPQILESIRPSEFARSIPNYRPLEKDMGRRRPRDGSGAGKRPAPRGSTSAPFIFRGLM